MISSIIIINAKATMKTHMFGKRGTQSSCLDSISNENISRHHNAVITASTNEPTILPALAICATNLKGNLAHAPNKAACTVATCKRLCRQPTKRVKDTQPARTVTAEGTLYINSGTLARLVITPASERQLQPQPRTDRKQQHPHPHQT
jgi:peptidyl-tRNA hydrolase